MGSRSMPWHQGVSGNHLTKTKTGFKARSTLKTRAAGNRWSSCLSSTPWGLSRPHRGRGVSIFYGVNMSQVSPQSRREFHAVFADWLSHASTEETEQLEALQVKYPPHQIRSMLTFIRECLADSTRCEELPGNLRTRLQARNWPQGGSVLQAA